MWSARQSPTGGVSAVPLTSQMRSHPAPRSAQALAVVVALRLHLFGFTDVVSGPDLFATATRSGASQINKDFTTASGPALFASATRVGPLPQASEAACRSLRQLAPDLLDPSISNHRRLPLPLLMVSTAISPTQHTRRTLRVTVRSGCVRPASSRGGAFPVHQPDRAPRRTSWYPHRKPVNPGRRTVLCARRTRLSSLSCGYSEKSKQQRSSVRTLPAWTYGTGVFTITWRTKCGWRLFLAQSTSGLLRNEMPTVSRLFKRRTTCFGRRGVASGNSTATRPGVNKAGRRSAAQVTSPLSLAQLACAALSALLLFRSATLELFIPVCAAQNVSLPCSCVTDKGTRSPHTHLPCL